MEIALREMIFITISYLIGCFSGAYYYGTIIKKTDIRNFGSGNLGALNAGRILGKKDFVIVFVIDFLKGVIVVLLASQLGLSDAGLLISMLFVVLGHIFPIQLGFKGGKGIATFLGVLTAFDYSIVFILLILFITVFLILRRFTIAGLISIVLLPLFLAFLSYSGEKVLVIVLFAIIIVIKHGKNIETYWKRNEN